MDSWQVIRETGYTFEFENVYDPNITLTIIATSERAAWEKLKKIK
ncbi:hypothetical protein [Halobacillus trueperi]|nr:hypothetical protein [Halobacillus trueperi]